ncbi:MAG: zf-HC2 domain-containing protein [Deltaproteobacteria bacterium]|nr:zf-HC2 domain-containing protein [Deltaproteobacteria bacterium]
MKCRKIEQQITPYLDGELPYDQARRLEMHVEECPSCMKLLEDEQKLWALLQKWPGLEPSPDFVEEFWQRAARLPTSPGWRQRLLDFLRPDGVLVPTMALAFSFFLCLWIYTQQWPLAQSTRQAVPSLSPDAVEAVISSTDREVIHQMAFLENMDMMRNLDVICNLEVLTVMGSRMADDSIRRNVSR